jgi:hypothetical protein
MIADAAGPAGQHQLLPFFFSAKPAVIDTHAHES